MAMEKHSVDRATWHHGRRTQVGLPRSAQAPNGMGAGKYWAIPENTLGVLQYAEHVLINGHARCTDRQARCTHVQEL